MIATNQTKAPPGLNAQLNNFIYLPSQNATTPIRRNLNPYVTIRHSISNFRPPSSKKPDISRFNHYLDFHHNRFGAMKNVYQLSEHFLLAARTQDIEKNKSAIKKVMLTVCIRDLINPPTFAFRVGHTDKQSYKQYFIDLTTHTTCSRLNDSKNIALNYYIIPNLPCLRG